MRDSYKEAVILIKLLNEKAKLLTEILNITDAQTKAIENSKFEKLDNLIQAKQGYIDKINYIDDSFAKQLKGIKEKFNIDQISELDVENEILLKINETTKEVYGLIAKIIKIDKRNSELINSNFQEVKSKLKNIKQGQKVTSNYYKQPIQTGGYFIDKGK